MLPSPSRGHAGGVSILGKGSPECTIIGSDSLTFHENPRVPKGHTPATIANYSNIFEAIDLQSTNLILAFQIHRRMVILDLQFWATSVMMSRCLEYLMIAIWLVALNFLFNCFFLQILHHFANFMFTPCGTWCSWDFIDCLLWATSHGCGCSSCFFHPCFLDKLFEEKRPHLPPARVYKSWPSTSMGSWIWKWRMLLCWYFCVLYCRVFKEVSTPCLRCHRPFFLLLWLWLWFL